MKKVIKLVEQEQDILEKMAELVNEYKVFFTITTTESPEHQIIQTINVYNDDTRVYDENCNETKIATEEYGKPFECCFGDWVPCNDGKLPNEGESVLITINDNCVEKCTFYKMILKNSSGDFIIHNVWKSGETGREYWDKEVTAWMPLPTPYKCVQKNNEKDINSKKDVKHHTIKLNSEKIGEAKNWFSNEEKEDY